MQKFKDPYLNRQIDLLRLDRSEVTKIALKYGLELNKQDENCEERLLEILEKYERILDRAQEFLAEPDSLIKLNPLQIDGEIIESLIVFSEIQEKESRYLDEILFDFPHDLSLSEVFARISKNARKVYQLISEENQ